MASGAAATPGLIVAATHSGAGKTVVTLGLLARLAREGCAVASAKVGPDYIDPRFHEAATGRPCFNLDLWAMRPETLASAIARLCEGARIAIVEGVMGLFDGADGEAGSTADLAQLTGWPVVLVVDARAQAASAGALVRGFAVHRPGVDVAGVVFNRVAGDRHAAILERAVAAATPGVRVLGHIPPAAALALPERHLGLVQAAEHGRLAEFIAGAAEQIGRHVDVQAIQGLARSASFPPPASSAHAAPIPPLGQRIAVADDVAFQFRYPLTVAGWREAGAEVRGFSPLADESPGADADAVYLPGGYPELHAGRLAGARRFHEGLRAAAARGAAILGECGGYMVLGEGLIDAAGARHAMAGLLPLETSFAERTLTLGYREAALAAGGPLGQAGARFRGHEFHYARIVREAPGEALFRCRNAAGAEVGPAGRVRGSVMGSFVHLIDRAG